MSNLCSSGLLVLATQQEGTLHRGRQNVSAAAVTGFVNRRARWDDEPMSTSSLGERVLTLAVLFATLGVVGWVMWMWLKRWWRAVNHP